MKLNSNDAYTETAARLEPDIAFIDAGAFYASAAISLKRIADLLEAHEKRVIEFYAKQDAEKVKAEF